MAALLLVGTTMGLLAQEWQVVTVNRVSLEGALKNGTPFEVRIECSKSRVIEEITVKASGDKIRFPKPAFEDLENPALQTVSLTSQPSGEMRLRFTGGESSANYEVEFFMQSGRLVKRNLTAFEAGGSDGKPRPVVKTTTF